MTPPTMAGWNLALRFGLELGALAGLGFAAWTITSGPVRWTALTLVPITAAVTWGVFNVVDDPSRSGTAPIEVDGRVRLAIEVLLMVGGAVAITVSGQREIGIVFLILVTAHYAASWNRVEWLVRERRRRPGDTSIAHGP